MTRRVLSAALSGTIGVTLLAGCSSAPPRTPVDTVGAVVFEQPLAIPPLAESHIAADGAREFELTAREGTHEFLSGTSTSTLGYNGEYLGPTIRAERGETVRVTVRNQLDTVTTAHWHGMHLPAEMDGGPHQPISPGAQWNPEWTVDQPAASLWYHPHPHGETEAQVDAGLAGMFIVDDPEERMLPLPREYGVDDVPLILQDHQLGADGVASAERSGELGTLGSTVSVNGTVGGVLPVTSRLTRLRLLNASPARIYNLAFSNGLPFQQIASDGGLLESPTERTSLLLSPGERAEIVVELAPGEEVVLRSEPFDLGAGEAADGIGANDRLDVLALHAADDLEPSPALPDRLTDIETLDARDTITTRGFVVEGTEINEQHMDMARIDAVVELGDTEVWEITNGNGNRPHNFHIHDVQFQVLEIDGTPPPPELTGWKDTVLLAPGQTARLIMRFEDYADAGSPYMFHCHLLWHEDRGMMGQFVVVRPGEQPRSPAVDAHHH